MRPCDITLILRFRMWLRSLFSRASMEQELDEELQSHIELKTQEYIAIGLTPANSYGLVALIGPVSMYWLLVHVSGIPPLEAHMMRSRGSAFEAYRRRVNAFFPGPARRIPSANRSLSL